jgi:hypothetical protein
MNETLEKYERTVDEETELLTRIETCDTYMTAILGHTYHSGKQHHKLTVEDILAAVFTISSDLRTGLMHVQLEKALLSNQIKQKNSR